jgi:hypothetical protein
VSSPPGILFGVREQASVKAGEVVKWVSCGVDCCAAEIELPMVIEQAADEPTDPDLLLGPFVPEDVR